MGRSLRQGASLGPCVSESGWWPLASLCPTFLSAGPWGRSFWKRMQPPSRCLHRASPHSLSPGHGLAREHPRQGRESPRGCRLAGPRSQPHSPPLERLAHPGGESRPLPGGRGALGARCCPLATSGREVGTAGVGMRRVWSLGGRRSVIPGHRAGCPAREEKGPRNPAQLAKPPSHLPADTDAFCPLHKGADLALTQLGARGGERQRATLACRGCSGSAPVPPARRWGWRETRASRTQPLLQGSRWGEETHPIVPLRLACCATLASRPNLPEPRSLQRGGRHSSRLAWRRRLGCACGPGPYKGGLVLCQACGSLQLGAFAGKKSGAREREGTCDSRPPACGRTPPPGRSLGLWLGGGGREWRAWGGSEPRPL